MRSCVLGIGLLVGCAVSQTPVGVYGGNDPQAAQARLQACIEKCSAIGMQVGGIVYHSDWSSACVCERPSAAPFTAKAAAAAPGSDISP